MIFLGLEREFKLTSMKSYCMYTTGGHRVFTPRSAAAIIILFSFIIFKYYSTVTSPNIAGP